MEVRRENRKGVLGRPNLGHEGRKPVRTPAVDPRPRRWGRGAEEAAAPSPAHISLST